jgi:hypothetical protein
MELYLHSHNTWCLVKAQEILRSFLHLFFSNYIIFIHVLCVCCSVKVQRNILHTVDRQSFGQWGKNLKIKIHKTVILPVVLYGCKTWTLTLREEHRLRVFKNSVEDIWT